jgi:hypothetical protein
MSEDFYAVCVIAFVALCFVASFTLCERANDQHRSYKLCLEKAEHVKDCEYIINDTDSKE